VLSRCSYCVVVVVVLIVFVIVVVVVVAVCHLLLVAVVVLLCCCYAFFCVFLFIIVLQKSTYQAVRAGGHTVADELERHRRGRHHRSRLPNSDAQQARFR